MELISIVYFILLLGFMVFVHELGHFVVAKRAGIRVDEFGIGFPPRLLTFRRGETLYSLNAIPLGGYVKMLGEEDPTHPRSFARAPKRWRIAVLVAGSTMNIIFAAIFFTLTFMVGFPTVTASQVEIVNVSPGGPAAQAGLQPGDTVISMAGQRINTAGDLRPITENNLGQEIPLEVRRNDQPVTLTIRPRTQWPEGQGPIGVAISDRPTQVEPVAHGPIDAAARGLRLTAMAVGSIVYVPVMVLQGAMPADAARVSGPVGIFHVTSQAVEETARTGWLYPILAMAGTLGAGLGVANLLPIPGLDGGRLIFVIIEAIRRRRINPEREAMIHLTGILVLLSLVIIITYFDILSPMQVDFGLP
jgi:regulator of sigma E protease